MKLITSKEQGNTNYPLPEDYYDLATEGQRQARVNACRQWMLRYDKLVDKQRAYVASLWFFDRWYLWPDEEEDFNPIFYDDIPVESPAFHWMIAEQWISWRKNMTIAPRGGAKSYFNCKDILLRMTARQAYTFIYATSTHPNARDTGERIKRQWLFNQRINDDWRLEFPDNRIVPKRGEGTFSTEHMMLMNGSWIRLLSAQSRQRGGRPRRYRLDDPEFDPRALTSMATLREYMDELLFKIVLPMVTRPDTGVDWIGTYVSKRHFLWHAMQVEDTPEGERSRDPRFNRWSRLHIPAAIEDKDGELVSCWEAMWPSTRKKRLQMAEKDFRYTDALSLEEIKQDVGTPVFNSEFMGRPGDAEHSFFILDQDTRGRHAYWFTDVDEEAVTSPTSSNTVIHWHENRKGVTHTMRMVLKEFLAEYVRLFITADTSYTSGRDSDFKVATLMAITPNNDLIVLDLWAEQCKEAKLVKGIFAMADVWKCPTIHPEVVKESVSLFNTLWSIVSTRAEEMAGTSHMPGIKKLNPGMTEKVAKIAALLFRFEHAKIKLPLWKRAVLPWRYLFDQIDEFNPDVEDGGLEKDDCIDTVSMSQFVLRGRLAKAPKQEKEQVPLVDRLKQGDFIDPDGTHIGVGLDLNQLSYQDINDILEARVYGDSSKPQPASKV